MTAEVTVPVWSILVLTGTVLVFGISLISMLMSEYRRRRTYKLQPMLGVVLPRQAKRRSTYVPPKRGGRHAK